MKITRIAEKINLNQVMDISVDVHKDTLNFFFASDGKEYTDLCSNRTDVIQRRIIKYKKIAEEHGMSSLRIVVNRPVSIKTACCVRQDTMAA